MWQTSYKTGFKVLLCRSYLALYNCGRVDVITNNLQLSCFKGVFKYWRIFRPKKKKNTEEYEFQEPELGLGWLGDGLFVKCNRFVMLLYMWLCLSIYSYIICTLILTRSTGHWWFPYVAVLVVLCPCYPPLLRWGTEWDFKRHPHPQSNQLTNINQQVKSNQKENIYMWMISDRLRRAYLQRHPKKLQ